MHFGGHARDTGRLRCCERKSTGFWSTRKGSISVVIAPRAIMIRPLGKRSSAAACPCIRAPVDWNSRKATGAVATENNTHSTTLIVTPLIAYPDPSGMGYILLVARVRVRNVWDSGPQHPFLLGLSPKLFIAGPLIYNTPRRRETNFRRRRQ